jgi:imidazolonepropionase-like amidohydrolase
MTPRGDGPPGAASRTARCSSAGGGPARTRRRARVVAAAVALATVFAGSVGASAQTAAPAPGEEGISRFQRFGIGAPPPGPPRPADEGLGPFKRLVLRSVMLVDGTGAPARGLVDIVVEQGLITRIASAGVPGDPLADEYRVPRASGPDERELDVDGGWVLPGFIDAHTHINTPNQGLAGPLLPSEYVYKLWLSHGITSVREVAAGMGLGFTVREKQRAARGEITAPRIYVYPMFPGRTVTTAQAAEAWVKAVHARGADGIKFRGASPEATKAAVATAKSLGMRTASHHDQTSVTRVDALVSARWGLDSVEHWYGLPEALFTDRVVQDYPADYVYDDEQDRFGQAGRLWLQAAAPGSDRWVAVIGELVERDVTLVPTFTIYEANRDVMRARRAEWHDAYTMPALMKFFQPDPRLHGSFHFDWTTADEIAWRRNFARWMEFVRDYRLAGGRVAAGSDAGFIYKLFGFAFVRELELMQEAGMHPLDVVRIATLNGAELLGIEAEAGSVEVGKRADLVIVGENPLANFKVLYGTGHVRLDRASREVGRVGAVRYTIRDGIVWDAERLRADVREMVAQARAGSRANGTGGDGGDTGGSGTGAAGAGGGGSDERRD